MASFASPLMLPYAEANAYPWESNYKILMENKGSS